MLKDIYSEDPHYFHEKELLTLNTEVSLLVILSITVINILAFLNIVYLNKKKKTETTSQSKNNLIKQVTERSPSFGTPMKNRRKCIRVPVENENCTVRFYDIGNPKLRSLRDKQINGYIKDISLSGLKMASNFELPVRSDICVMVSFELHGVPLNLKGQIVRREDHLGEEFVIYGLQFQNLNRQAQLEISKFINKKTKVSGNLELAGSF